MTTVVLLGVLVGLAVGAGAVWLLYRLRRRQLVALKSGAEGTASRILEEARKEGDAIRREAQIQAKDLLIKTKAESEEDAREQRRELVALEKRVAQKEESIAQRIETFTQREADLGARDEAMRQKERSAEQRRTEYDKLVEAVRQTLEQTAGMTRDEAKKTLVEQMLDEARHDAARHIRQIEQEGFIDRVYAKK